MRVPGDITITAMALAVAALARGESVVETASFGPETAALAVALGALGVRVTRNANTWRIEGVGMNGLLAPQTDLDAGRSPLVAALLLGLCGTSDFDARVVGNLDAPEQFAPLFDGLRRYGAAVAESGRGYWHADVRGPVLAPPIRHELPPDAALAKPALLLAALQSPGISSFTEGATLPNHAERMLGAFGAGLSVTPGAEAGRTFELGRFPSIRGRTVRVPGDPSLAALAAVAASVVPGSELRIEQVLLNPARTMFLSALVAMGASVEAHGFASHDGEEVADIAVVHQPLRGITLGAGHVSLMLEEIPYLAVAAAFADGDTVLQLPEDLPAGARARVASAIRGLAANGVFCEADEQTLVIHGTGEVRGGGRVATGQDPAIGMAFLVMGMAAREQVTIDDRTGIEERFPGFVEAFEKAGARFVRLT